MEGKRNLSGVEIDQYVDIYNKKYHLQLKRYTYNSSNGHSLEELNKDINTLKESSSLTALVSLSSHTFALKVEKLNGKNFIIVDEPYALLNTKDYKISMENSFEIFAYLSRNEYVEFIKSLPHSEKLFINQNRYQLDVGSCHTYALINAKQLASNRVYFDCHTSQFCDSLNRDIFLYSQKEKHIKYGQEKDEKKIVHFDVLQEEIKVHQKTAKIRETLLSIKEKSTDEDENINKPTDQPKF